MKKLFNFYSAATAQQPQKWWLLMVFSFILFATGGQQKVLGQVCPTPPNACQLVCNPSITSTCNANYNDIFMSGIGVRECCNPNPPGVSCYPFPGWSDIYGTCDYIDDGLTTLTGDSKLMRMGIANSVGCQGGEGLQTNATIEPNSTYLLVYTRGFWGAVDATYTCSVPLTAANNNNQSQALHLMENCTGAFSVYRPSTSLDNLFVKLTNSNQITWDTHSYDYTNQPVNARTLVQESTILAANDELGNNTIDWERRSSCFSTNNTENWNTLYIYPQQNMGNYCNGYLLLDEIYLLKDSFPTLQTNYQICNGQSLTIGEVCSNDFPYAAYQWQKNTGTGWTTIAGATSASLTGSPNVTTTYRLTRSFTNGVTAPCFQNSVDITVQVTPTEICCSQLTVFNTLPTIPASTVGWSAGVGNNPWNATATTPILLNSNLIIPAQANLIISGLNFEFGPNGRITVMPNAKLKLDNTTIKGLQTCQSMWQGIRVLGPGQGVLRNAVGGVANFGTLEIKNATRIEDAFIGVACMNTAMINFEDVQTQLLTYSNNLYTLGSLIIPQYVSTSLARNTAGGVLLCKDAITTLPLFKNCFQGINLSWFNNSFNDGLFNSTTLIKNTNFLCDRYLWYPFTNIPNVNGSAGVISEAGIHINFYTNWGDDLANITNCRFTNQSFGIRCFEALDFVVDNCWFEKTAFPSSFRTVGVSVFNFSNSPLLSTDFSIRNNVFENNFVAIQNAGGDTEMAFNEINPNATSSNYLTNYIGILNVGSLYQIHDNQIKRVGTGVAIQNNGQQVGKIKLNTFTNVLYGIRSIGNNQGNTTVCNDFNNYTVALLAQDATLFGNAAGNLDNQGICPPESGADKDPADNRFYTQIPFGGIFPPQIYSTMADQFIYYYRPATNYVPTANPITIPVACEPGNEADNCDDFIVQDNDVVNLVDETLQDKALLASIRHYVVDLHDTLSAVNLLAAVNSYLAKRLSLDYYIQHQNYTQAQTLLNSLPTNTPERQDFKTLYQIRLNLEQSNRSIFELTPTEDATITTMANLARSNFGFEAQAMLYLVRGREFPIQLPPVPAGLPTDNGTSIQFKNQTDPNSAKFSAIYPNPSANNLYLNYQLTDTEKATICLYNLNGQLVLQQHISGNGQLQMPTQNLPAGIYYYTIVLNNQLVVRSKVVIL